MNLALRPSNFQFIYSAPTLIKRDLLLFDQVHICNHDHFTIFNELESTDPQYLDFIQRYLEPYRKNALVFDFDLAGILKFLITDPSVKKGKIDKNTFSAIVSIGHSHFKIQRPDHKIFPKKYPGKRKAERIMMKYTNAVNAQESEATRVAGVLLNRFSKNDQAFPILDDLSVTGGYPHSKASVLEIVLKKLPIPDESISIEQLIEYRSDKTTSAKLNALRVWMQDIGRSDYTKTEIEERLDSLLHEYEEHLRFHKIKFHRGFLRIALTTSLELIENLAKLRFGKISEALFTLNDKKVDLLEAELGAPGREIAYISKTKKQFTNKE